MAFDAGLHDGLRGMGQQPGFVHKRSLSVGGVVTDVEYRATATEEVGRQEAASKLLNNRYAWRGYGGEHEIPAGAQHTTFTTEIGGEVVGTLTLAIDSTQGLAIDQTFPGRAAEARSRPGAHICELTRFAFDGSIRSKEVLAGLFHMVFIYGTLTSDCTDLFIEVHPRHASFYQAMLGFQTVGEAGVNVSVGAPSQLMQLGVGEIGARIAAAAPGAKTSSQHSLYPHFFPALEEAEIRSAAVLNAMRSRLQSKPLRRTDMRTIRGDLVRRGSAAAASATDLYLPRPGTLDALQAPGCPDVSCAA